MAKTTIDRPPVTETRLRRSPDSSIPSSNESEPMNLFTYGVLMYSEIFRALTGRELSSEPATLNGFRRHALIMDGYPKVPAIVPAAGATVEGVLIRGVDQETLEVLDEFEEVSKGLYVRERVAVRDRAGCERRADAYMAGPAALGSLSGSWDPQEFVEQHYAEYLNGAFRGFSQPAD